MKEWTDTATYELGNTVESGGTFYIRFVETFSLDNCELIKKSPVHHGPLKKRGKGKVNRDWEK